MAKTTKKIALNANKIAPDAILEQENREPMVMVTSAQLDALIAQNKEYKQKLAEVNGDIERVVKILFNVRKNLGIGENTSSVKITGMVMKLIPSILSGDLPEWMEKDFFMSLSKYLPENNSKNENTTENPGKQ